jgi:MFS family permease
MTTMAELFPGSKGKITGMVYSLNSIAVFSAPVITGWLANTNTMNTMVYNAAVSGLAPGKSSAIVVNPNCNIPLVKPVTITVIKHKSGDGAIVNAIKQTIVING